MINDKGLAEFIKNESKVSLADKERLNEPELTITERFLIESFYQLRTDRNVGIDIGPIPWTSIYSYASYLSLNMYPLEIDYDEYPITLNEFMFLISSLDNLELKMIHEKNNKEFSKK